MKLVKYYKKLNRKNKLKYLEMRKIYRYMIILVMLLDFFLSIVFFYDLFIWLFIWY